MLRAFGHEEVSVLDGGLQAAKALGLKLKEETYTGIGDLRLKQKAGTMSGGEWCCHEQHFDVIPDDKAQELAYFILQCQALTHSYSNWNFWGICQYFFHKVIDAGAPPHVIISSFPWGKKKLT